MKFRTTEEHKAHVCEKVVHAINTGLTGYVAPSPQSAAAVIKTIVVQCLMDLLSTGIIDPYRNGDGSHRAIDPENDVFVSRDGIWFRFHNGQKYLYCGLSTSSGRS